MTKSYALSLACERHQDSDGVRRLRPKYPDCRVLGQSRSAAGLLLYYAIVSLKGA